MRLSTGIAGNGGATGGNLGDKGEKAGFVHLSSGGKVPHMMPTSTIRAEIGRKSMNKVLGLVVAIAAVAAGAWYFTRSPEMQPEATATTEAPAAETSAADAAAQAASEAAAAATQAAQAAGEAVNAAADAAAEAVNQAATDAAAAATEAANNAATAATDAATAAVEGAGDMMDAAKALTVESFDADKVIEMIDTSTLAEESKAALKAVVEGARANPTLISGAIDQVKAALGL